MLGHQKKVYVPTFILILLFQTYCKHDRGWIRKTISRLRLTEKDHTHVRKVGHTPEFLFGIYWWTLKKLKNLTFEKMKKIAGDIIILHMWTKNHNHTRLQFLRYGVKQNVLSFWAIFCPFNLNPLTTQKTTILKKWKASGDVII